MDGRAHKRVSIDREIKCMIAGSQAWIRLYDLSAGGAMIEVGGYSLEVGDPVEIDLYEMITVSGEVVWRAGKNAGIRFHGPVAGWILEKLGFSATSLGFDELPPRDRYGELLAEKPIVAPAAPPGEPCTDDCNGMQPERGSPPNIDVRVALGAELKDAVEARLANISSTGCCFVDPATTLKLRDLVWLQFESFLPWQGEVRWVVGDKVGVAFERPLHPAVADHILKGSGTVLCFKAR